MAEQERGLTPEQRNKLVDKLTADLVEGASRMSLTLWDMAKEGFVGFDQRTDEHLLQNHRDAFDEEFLEDEEESE